MFKIGSVPGIIIQKFHSCNLFNNSRAVYGESLSYDFHKMAKNRYRSRARSALPSRLICLIPREVMKIN
jgi:hypothetical protein